MNKSNKSKIPYCYNKIFPIMIFIATLFMGIGYAAISAISLEVSGIATANEQNTLFISGVKFSSSKNENTEKLNTVSILETTINSIVTLSDKDPTSYVSYIITIYNNTNDTYYYDGTTYDQSFYDNSDIVYSVRNLSNDNILRSNKEALFEITFEYKDSKLASNNVLNSYIKFSFSKIHFITYKNIAGNNLPEYVVDKDDLNITFTNSVPYSVEIYKDNNLTTDYTYDNKILNVPSVEGEIRVEGFIPEPDLGEDLIPVIYNGSNWIAVDENSNWYDYGKQEWANAVIAKSGVSISSGDVVDLEKDIKGIFVWIPRYEYKIATDGSKEIYINFIPNEVVTTTSGYVLPDGFYFGTDEIDGFWFGKFEPSMDSENNELYIIPNAVAATSQIMSGFYNLGLGFNDDFTNSNIDSHMVKNSEWALAAYLSHSLYGKFGNSDYTGNNREVYVNNSSGLYTGKSGGSISPSGDYFGTYSYDDGFDGDTEKSGIGASTTGNIYGIYDMSGGAYEYVMGWLTTASSTFGSSSGYNAAGFSSTPNSKYYNGYTSSTSSTYPYKSHALYETKGWHGDGSATINASEPWYMRGGVCDGGAAAGIFAYGITTGYMGSYATFRIALVVSS